MPLIDLNDFWSQVREDTRKRLPDQIWKTTIYWLLPVELDEQNNKLVLTTMQNYIQEIIEKDARISRQLKDSINKLWKEVNPTSNQSINFVITSVEYGISDDEPSDETNITDTYATHTTDTDTNVSNSGTTTDYTEAVEANDFHETVEPVMPKASTVDVTPAHIPHATLADTATTAPAHQSPMDISSYTNHDPINVVPSEPLPSYEDDSYELSLSRNTHSSSNSSEEYIGSYEEMAHKLGFEPKKTTKTNSLATKPVYEEPVYIEPPRKHSMPHIPQESLFPEEDMTPTATYSKSNADTASMSHTQEGAPIESTMNSWPKKSFTKQEENILSASMLNPKYTFDNFIVAGSTLLNKAIAQSVAKTPGKINPYYIYGQSGMGKTHLMHAIGHEILKHNPAARIMCIPAQKYVEYFTSSLTNNKDVPKDIFHDIDVLLLDDVQAFQNKVGTRADFFHLFNDLILKNKQIVLTCDVLPEDLGDVEERLKNRFAAGMVTTIEPPSPEVLEAILLSKLDNERTTNPELRMDTSVIRFLAQAYSMGSIRKLEGAFTKLITVASIEGRSNHITVEYALEVLADLLPNNERRVLSINYIQDFIADYFKIKKDLLVSKKRNKQYAHPRQIARFLCRDLINESYPQIALAFGKKDHTTVLHAFNKIEAELAKDSDLQHTIEDIKKKIQENT
ncbi:chromosomal replication initiator protein DnaA [uncultured Veillonella sp.]|uniref:chromosomal replication initiator protein DnaA n=1 Tax=uncultured Veillonella sp. TaxID=159268 RepID=UPI0026054474|nr:chromosomal replication initiator protein DnaA [uncultured Veillonella sp.]